MTNKSNGAQLRYARLAGGMKWVAFDSWGRLIPDHTLSLIIDQALRGKMTQSAENILLIPDTRKGRPDASGLQEMGRVRKKECITLGQFSRKIRKRPTESQKSKKTRV
jgi:hypothetical protein